jgi:YfiH family protein
LTARLEQVERGGIGLLTDPVLAAEDGILVAFTQRIGGRSRSPYGSLNLAAHVGDEPATVDENRATLLRALDLERARARVTTAEQVHGLRIREVAGAEVGMGAFARSGGPPPVPVTDALWTRESDAPLLMLYADCVPVVLVARAPVRAVAVVHAGWKGALGRLAGKAALALCRAVGCAPDALTAYIGPHIGSCHYQVDAARLSHFANAFGSIAAAQGGLDLGAVVSASMSEVGVPLSNVVRAGVCTAERTDAYYSYRAEGTTGRHGALAVILGRT